MTEANGEVVKVAGGKKRHPTRGKRYSPSLRKEILEYAGGNGVESASRKYGVTETTIYEWRRAVKLRGSETGNLMLGQTEEEESKAQRDRRVLAMWRQHPGWGRTNSRVTRGHLKSLKRQT